MHALQHDLCWFALACIAAGGVVMLVKRTVVPAYMLLIYAGVTCGAIQGLLSFGILSMTLIGLELALALASLVTLKFRH